MKIMVYIRHQTDEEGDGYITYPNLEINHKYLVLYETAVKDRVIAKDLNGHFLGWFPKACFKFLKEVRKEKLKQLG